MPSARQREVQLPARAGEKLALEIAERLLDLGAGAQQDGHRDQCAKLLRHMARQIERRQDRRFDQPGNRHCSPSAITTSLAGSNSSSSSPAPVASGNGGRKCATLDTSPADSPVTSDR